jgi:hypothetical protein
MARKPVARNHVGIRYGRLSARVTMVVVVFGALILGAGLLLYRSVNAAAGQLRSSGESVSAVITDLHDRRTSFIDVTYRTDDGIERKAEIVVPFVEDYRQGDTITIYVDPERPDDVVTADGHSSSYGKQRTARELSISGGVLIVIAIVQFFLDRLRPRKTITKGSLVIRVD